MIQNTHIDQLLNVEQVDSFLKNMSMKSVTCIDGDDASLLLYRIPYVVEICDSLIENYLSIHLSNLDENLMIDGNSLLECSIDMNLQNLTEIQGRKFDNLPENDIFLSWKIEKTGDLNCTLEAIGKILPLIEARGMKSMLNGTFHTSFDFKKSVHIMHQGLKEKYLKCLAGS